MRTSTHRFSWLWMPLLAAALQGCTSLAGVGGSSEFSCKAQPGVHCDSVSGNYQNALQNNLPGQRSGTGPSSSLGTPEARGATAIVRAQPAALITSPPEGRSMWPAPSNANALRAPARILRLWFKPWEDADQDLFDQGYVYVQVDGGRWMVDRAQRKIRDGYAPIRPPRTAQTTGSPAAARTAEPAAVSRSGAPLSSGEEALEHLSALKSAGKPDLGAAEE